MSELDQRLSEIARVPVLLVASDYDGTIAPIVDDPTRATPVRQTIVAIERLAELPQTHMALVSGRSLRDLAELTGLSESVHLVGSHGSEFDLDFATSLSPETARLRQQVLEELCEIAATHEGLNIEEKPASIAFHYRGVDDHIADAAVEKITSGPAARAGVFVKRGKRVIELGVVATSKAGALETVRHRVGASAVVFMGDDQTDEEAFSTLTGPDIAIKVGEGETIAPFRIEGPYDAARLIARLAEMRAEWLEGSDATPIEEHSMLSDQRTIALVTPNARVTWLCVPRIDSPSIFSELLGGPAAGHFTIASADGAPPTEQRYREATMTVETDWPNFTVTDFLDCSGGRPGHRAGRTDLLRVIKGTGRVVIEFAPRLDYGRLTTRLTARPGGIEIEDTLDPIVLRAPGVEWTIHEEGKHHIARGEIELNDEPVVLELCHGTGSLRNGSSTAPDRLQRTERFWKSWADRLTLPNVERDLVLRSAVILKALCYGPTGAISAAGTTSLPEHVGGVRNWDYRFCWLRDAAMSAAALVKLGSISEAMDFLDWVLGVVDDCESPERLHPLYTVLGSETGAEAEIGELAGYRGSRPVRVGNRAARQVQLDVFGPIVDLVALLSERDAPLASHHWRLVEAMVQAVERRWHEPDHGIWEIRKPRRHHVHSKTMCWLTAHRAIEIARRHLDQEREDWMALRDAIAHDVLSKGYKQEAHAFTAAYDGLDLDAATLHVGLCGLVAPDDDRFQGTLRGIERVLRKGPTVYRYRSDDGLPGFEGGFHICASWLVEAYLRLGRVDEAQLLFNDIVALAGPTGVMSEQYGPNSKRALGNVPQAYSHIGVIENALHLDAIARGSD